MQLNKGFSKTRLYKIYYQIVLVNEKLVVAIIGNGLKTCYEERS